MAELRTIGRTVLARILLCHRSNFFPASVSVPRDPPDSPTTPCGPCTQASPVLCTSSDKFVSPTALPWWMLYCGAGIWIQVCLMAQPEPRLSPLEGRAHRWRSTHTEQRTWATLLKPGHASCAHTQLKSIPANCRPVFQRTRNCSQHLEERLIIVPRSSCSHTHNYPVFTCKYPSAHGFFGKCQLHRCNPGAQIWELGIQRCTQALSQLWTGIITIISPNGYVCHSITMADDSVSLPHLFTTLPPLTPLLRKPATSCLTVLPTPTLPFKMKSPDVGDPSVVCVTFLASSFI